MGREGVVSRQVDIKNREKIMQIISDPGSRKNFKDNSKKALKDAGVAARPILDQLVGALTEMSLEELAVIAKLNKKLVDMGLTAENSQVIAMAV
jgi:hypothetical protein